MTRRWRLLRSLQQLTDVGAASSEQAGELSRAVVERSPRCALGYFYLGKALVFEELDPKWPPSFVDALDLGPDETTEVFATRPAISASCYGRLGTQERATCSWSTWLRRNLGDLYVGMVRMVLKGPPT